MHRDFGPAAECQLITSVIVALMIYGNRALEAAGMKGNAAHCTEPRLLPIFTAHFYGLVYKEMDYTGTMVPVAVVYT